MSRIGCRVLLHNKIYSRKSSIILVNKQNYHHPFKISDYTMDYDDIIQMKIKIGKEVYKTGACPTTGDYYMKYECETFNFVLHADLDEPVTLTYTIYLKRLHEILIVFDEIYNGGVKPYIHELHELFRTAPKTHRSMYVHMLNGFKRLEKTLYTRLAESSLRQYGYKD